jgi:hypothetical protein
MAAIDAHATMEELLAAVSSLRQHKVRKIGMICFAEPQLTEDLFTVKREEFSITCHKCDTYT